MLWLFLNPFLQFFFLGNTLFCNMFAPSPKISLFLPLFTVLEFQFPNWKILSFSSKYQTWLPFSHSVKNTWLFFFSAFNRIYLLNVSSAALTVIVSTKEERWSHLLFTTLSVGRYIQIIHKLLVALCLEKGKNIKTSLVLTRIIYFHLWLQNDDIYPSVTHTKLNTNKNV